MADWVTLKMVTDATAEPVDRFEAKQHLRVDITADDDLIDALITAARRMVERISGRALMTQTWDLVFDEWPALPLQIPRPPLSSITHIRYKDEAGNESTFASENYIVDTNSEPGRIALAKNKTWPADVLYAIAPVVVRFVAGHSTADDVSQEFKQAILLAVGHWYENREAIATSGAVPKELPMAVQSLLWLDRVKRF